MNEETQTQLLISIKEELIKSNTKLDQLCIQLASDRSNLWKVLLLTIGGAFALIGIKLVLPS